MRVLYISYDGMTDALGRSQVIPYLQGLSKSGHKIWVISSEKRNIPAAETLEVKNIFEQSGITWHPLRFSTRPPGIAKFIDIFRTKRAALSLHQIINFNLVHCRSYIAALAGLQLKMKYGVKFVFDMRGFWANERIDGNMWNLSNPFHRLIYNYFKKKEKLFFNHADAVISLTHNGKGVIRELFGEEVEKKTTVIPCCVDTEFFSREHINVKALKLLRHELGIDEHELVVSYLGSTGTWYLTDEMMQFFRKVLIRYPTARFLFISGDAPEFIHGKAALNGVPADKVIIARAPRNLVPLYLALSSVSVFFIKPVFSKRASSPTKQAEIMSMGIPLICNAGVGDTDLLLSDEKAGVVIKDFSEQEFERATQMIDSIVKLNPEFIRQKACDMFSLTEGIGRYATVYASMDR